MNLKGSFRFISFAAFLLIVCLLFMGSSSLATDSDLYRSPDEPVLLGDEKNQDEDAGLIGSSPTIITVNSGTDPDRHNSYTCDNNPDGLCTLRRAVIQARNTTGPVEIRFNIPTTCSSYVSSIGMWKIRFAGLSTDPATLRYLTGNITIDGTTQPGGRPSGPKIILYGANPSHDGIKLGQSQTQNGNIIRGLGFQNFKDHITITSGDNLVENCWFGLNDEGTMPYLRNSSPAQGSGVSGVVFTTSARNSIVRNNYFLGLNGTASTIRGQDNKFLNNYVGTRADGKVTNPGCSTDSWLGGGGVTIQGRRHQIKNNLIAGLRFDQFYMSQPPNALQITADDITGAGHQVIGNVIGRDIDGRVVGTCARGIYVHNHMRGTLLQDNIIDSTAQPGISINGLLYNQMEMRGNLIFGTSIEMGAQLPNGFKNYKPAAITVMSGTEIRGTSGAGSPGPNCWIEVFLDDTSSPAEAKQLLARVQADAEGRWSARIPSALTGNQGLRTTTTTVSDNTIPGALAGTTTALSDFYSIDGVTPDTCTLTVNSTNPTSGVAISSTVTAYGGTTSYTRSIPQGTRVTLTAPEYHGSGAARKRFSNWSGAVNGTNRTITLTMNANHDHLVTANYLNNPVTPVLPRVTLRSPPNNAGVDGTRVVFRWNSATRATRYQLQIRRASDDSIFKNLRLGNVTQRTFVDFPANNASYRWRVRAGNADGWGRWSVYRTVNNPFGAFNHNFNNTRSYQGWVRRPQELWSLNNQEMLSVTAGVTTGQKGFTSARRGNVYYYNLDYSARMRRTNSDYGSGIVIRAGSKYKANGDWYPGYQFLYRNDGYYSIWKLSANGVDTALQNWAQSNHINKNGWNNLRVVAVGNNLRFYINGQLVRNLNDGSLKSGMVGVIARRASTDPASDRLLVDWARLSQPAGSQAAMETIDPEQQAFNEAAQSKTVASRVGEIGGYNLIPLEQKNLNTEAGAEEE